jgi:hypothetical protein
VPVCGTNDERLIYREIFMNQQTKNIHPKPQPPNPSSLDVVNMQKRKAENKEVAGRHKNDGQKGHKGAR